MTRVKICGITREADREVAVRAGADAVGFIVDVAVETPREIPAARARDLVAGVPPFVTTVLVTMPESVQAAVALQDRVGADAIQVHATLDPGEVGVLTERLDADVLAAVDPDA
ncbi:N-(5'-phosphoribosyl)anthranilate isomerase, partial [Halobacteriales archaeon SW_10_68_16]